METNLYIKEVVFCKGLQERNIMISINPNHHAFVLLHETFVIDWLVRYFSFIAHSF
jgi:hypothetical protein